MPEGDRPITLFAGGTGGYGDALDVGRDSYNWAIGYDFSALGRATVALAPTDLDTGSGGIVMEIGAAFEVRDSAGSPGILVANGLANAFRRVGVIRNNGYTPAEDLEGGASYTGGVHYRHDGSDANAQMSFFCNGTDGSVIRRRTVDATGAIYSDGTDAKADQLFVVGADLWRAIDGYKLEKLVLGTDPGVEGNWSAVRTPVGTPAFPINMVLELGGSPFVLTGSGAYKYNAAPSTARFENQTPFIQAHQDNGKGGFADGRGRIYYPTVDGPILVLSFGSQTQQGPLRFNWIDRNTPWGAIGAMAAGAEHIYAAVEPGSIRTQQLGLVMKVDDGGSFTTPTNAVTDQSYATNADVGLLQSVNTDWVYFGSDEPFWGVFVEMAVESTGVATVLKGQVSTGTSTFDTVDIHDSTRVLTGDGCIAIMGLVNSDTADIFADGTWVKGTVDGVSKYWFRFTADNSLLSAKIREVYLCPYRPPLDAALFPVTGQALAGVLPRLLIGTWRGESIVWQDVGVMEMAKIEKIIVGRTSGANSTGRQTLWLLGPDSIRYFPIGADANPVRAAWPNTNGATHAMEFSGNDFGLPGNIKSVQKLIIPGEHLQADDEFWVYWRYDLDDRWYSDGPHSAFPVEVNDLLGRGRVLHVAVQQNDASRDAIAAYFTKCVIPEGMWTDEGPLHEALGTDIESPQVV